MSENKVSIGTHKKPIKKWVLFPLYSVTTGYSIYPIVYKEKEYVVKLNGVIFPEDIKSIYWFIKENIPTTATIYEYSQHNNRTGKLCYRCSLFNLKFDDDENIHCIGHVRKDAVMNNLQKLLDDLFEHYENFLQKKDQDNMFVLGKPGAGKMSSIISPNTMDDLTRKMSSIKR